MDLQINRTPPGTIGPAEEILNRHGLDKGYECTSYVFEKHGNLSPAFITLRDHNTPRAQVEGMFKSDLNQF